MPTQGGEFELNPEELDLYSSLGGGIESAGGLFLPQNVGFTTGPVQVGAISHFALPDDPGAGLALPQANPTTLFDLVGVYLTLSEDFGVRVPLELIRNHLGKAGIEDLMWALSQIAHKADQSVPGRNRVELQREMVENLLPVPLIPTALDLVTNHQRSVTSSQLVLTLALHALDVDHPKAELLPDFTGLVRGLGLSLLAIADHVPVAGDSIEELTIDLTRNEMFYRLQSGLLERYDEAHRILFEVIPSLHDHPDHFDVAETVESATGLNLSDFWCLTAAMGIYSAGLDAPVRFPLQGSGVRVTDSTISKWESVWTIGLDDARTSAAADLATGTGWAFTTFFDRPILRIDDERRFAIRSHFLVEKASPMGMFWLIDRARRQLGIEDHESWSRLFGKAVEVRGQQIVADHVGDPSRVLDEDAIRSKWPPKSGQPTCDLLVIYPDAWLVCDFVHRSPTRATLATGDYGDLVNDLEKAVVKKVMQIDGTLDRILQSGTLSRPRRIVPVVVTGAAFPANPLISKAISDLLDPLHTQVINSEPICRKPAVIDTEELRWLIDSAASSGVLMTDLIDEWTDSPLGSSSFRNWLTTDGRRHMQRQFGHWDWYDHVRQNIFDQPDS